MVKRLLCFLVTTLFIVSVGFAQTGQSGAINGTVTDSDNVKLPGVTVVLKSPALVLPQLTTVTNANGVYRFPMLAPGTYEITFQLEGMNTLVRKGIVVSLGRTITVDVGMTLKSLEEQIVVSGKAPTVDRQSTVGAANMDEEFLKSIPTQNRDFMDYFNLTPGVTSDTAHGSSQMDNSYNLDGVNMGDPATGTYYVGFGMDIMEEISVQSGGLTAEYGSVKGAVVNVVTKSGGNNFSGSASFYFNHESLQSENTKGTDLYDPEGPSEKTGQKFQYEPVLTLGGPLVKDKIWFFGNFSFSKDETYAPGYPWDKAPGDEDIPADRLRWFPYVKLTYHPNQQNKFMFSYNFSTTKRNHRGASRYYNVDTTRTQNSPTHVFNLHWTRFFGENVYVNLKLAYIDYLMELHSKTPGVQYVDYITSFNSGSYWRNKDDNVRDRYQVNLDATTFIDDLAGSHELKFGGELQFANVGWNVEVYSHPLNGVGYALMYPEYFGEPGWYVGYNFNGGFDRKEQMLNIGFFVQDTWTVSNHLTLNLGLRYDYQSLIWPVQGMDQTSIWNPFGEPVNKSMPEKTTPLKWNDISPRLGLIYDLFADGTTLFKASWARYVQPNQVGWINIAHPNGWFAYTVWMDPNGNPTRYTPFWSPGASVGIGYGDQELSAPYANELTLGLEREMWEDWSLGLRYIKKWDRNLIHSVDAARLDMDALMNNGELIWLGYENADVVDPYTGNTVTFYNEIDPSRNIQEYIVNPPDAYRDYDGLEVTLNKRYSHGWSLSASYVYQNSRGTISTARGGQSLGTSTLYHDPNAHVNNDGRFPFESRHQVKITGLIKGPWGINFSGYFRHLSGQRWTRTVTSDYLVGVGWLNQGSETIFADKRGTEGLPDQNLLDLRVEKAFKIKNWRFKVFADIFNVFNANTTTNLRTDSSHPRYTYKETTDIIDPRVVRLGAKIEFN